MEYLSIGSFTQDIIEGYKEHSFLCNLILSLVISFLLVFTAIPKIIRVSYRKHLMDEPGTRSSHVKKVPNLGGLALFYGISITASIFAYSLFSEYIFLFASLVILLFVGLMDDILVVSPDKKLYAQLAVSIMMVVFSDVRIGNFFGILGIEEIPYWISVIFTIIVFIVLINSYNLIDGIDGLAGTFAIISGIGFMYSFYILNIPNLVVLSACMIGALIAFLIYNLSEKWKIFMGDTGSMIIGFLLTFMAIKFLNFLMVQTISGTPIYHLPSAPAIAIALLIIPIVDTLSVAFIRIKNGRSPLYADKNHIHHRYLKLGLNHKQVSLITSAAFIIILLITYYFKNLNVNILGVIVVGIGLLFSLMPNFILYFKNSES